MKQQAYAPEDKIFTRAFVLLAFVNLLAFIGWHMMLTGLPLYLDMLGADPVYVGLATTLATGASVIVRPLSGIVIDRYGRKSILVVGFLVMAVSMAFYAIIPVAGVVLAARFVHGLGWGFGSTANSTIVADIIPRKRFAEAMGYFSVTNSLAMALAPAISIWLMENNYSEIMIYAAAGATIVSVIGAVILFVTDYQQPPLKKNLPLSKAFAPENMFEKSALFPSAIMFIEFLGVGAVATFLALMAADRGIEGIAVYFIVYAVTSVVTRPLVGPWIDQKGFFAPGIVACVTLAASLVVVAFAQDMIAVVAAGLLVGLGVSISMSVFQTMAVAIAAPNSRGAAMSTFLFLFNGGIAVGAFLAGALVEPIGYDGMFLVFAALAVIGCIAFVAGGRKRIDRYHDLQQR